MMSAAVRPRITFLLAYTVPTLGMERSTIRVVEALRENFDITIVSVMGPSAPVPGVRSTSLTSPGRFSAARKWLALAWWSRHAPERVVAVGTWVAVPWLLVQRRRSVRTLVWEHSLSRANIANTRSLRILAPLARLLYRRAAAVVVVSDPLRADLRELIPGIGAEVIPNVTEGASAPHVQRHAPSERAQPAKKLLTIGSLTRTKRQWVAIEALAQLPEDVTLDIVGSGPEAGSLANRAKERGVDGRVRFHGYLDQPRIGQLLQEADLLVHPSAGETFGLVLFEAASAGVPVLAQDGPLTQWVIPRYVPGSVFSGAAAELAAAVRGDDYLLDAAAQQQALKNRTRDLSTSAIAAMWNGVLRTFSAETQLP